MDIQVTYNNSLVHLYSINEFQIYEDPGITASVI